MAANSHVPPGTGGDAEGMKVRCVVVDDSARFLAAIRVLLERQGMPVVGVASSTAEALERITALRPEVTLLDVHLGEESGVELARRLVRERAVPPSRLILMSSRAPEDLADLTAERVVAGFLVKSELSADAIRVLLGPDDVLPISAPEGR
jgi:DNA-binding NarL/FixJ family response regulator